MEEYGDGSDWKGVVKREVIFEGGRKEMRKGMVMSRWEGIEDEGKEWLEELGDMVVDEVERWKCEKVC